MLNHTFFIVVRDKEWHFHRDKFYLDRFGYEYADGIEIFDYEKAKQMRKEYELAFPNFTVLIRSKRIIN